MKVSPINTNHNNTNFKAVIKSSDSLKEGFGLVERCVATGTNKDMNTVKEFLDGLARISESKKIQEFKIDIDKRRPEYTYTKINNRRVSGGYNGYRQNLQDSYLVVEGVKNFASKLEEAEPSILDSLKAQVDEAEAVLDNLRERYYNRLKAELEQAKKIIFNSAE